MMFRNRQSLDFVLWASLIITLGVTTVSAQETPEKLTLERIFSTNEFNLDPAPRLRWLARNGGYTILVDAKDDNVAGKSIVRVDPATGEQEVLVRADELIPSGQQKPLEIRDYSWSDDDRHLLIFTNTRKVWRRHTRGDYWSFDLKSRSLKQVGAQFEPARLMFAKYSPDATRIAYVFKNNIYVEDLKSSKVTALTTDGHETLINGTFDWVYEEEFGLRDGFRWSPDGRAIAFWQLDSTELKDFLLINNTSELYPTTTSLQYPKVGDKNSNCRVGSVRLDTGEIVWAKIKGDPTNNYLVSLEWLKDSKTLCVQQLNRLQNTIRIQKVDAATGNAAVFFTEQEDAWLDHHGPLQWIANEERFLRISERSGWRQLLSISNQSGDVVSVTPDTFDLISLLKVDENNGWAYYLASPDNATQKFLYRSRLDGSKTERLTPEDQPGTHAYQISSDSKWALHTYSSHSQPPVSELIRLPAHQQQRMFADNQRLKTKVAELGLPPVEFFRVDIGEGVELDAWCMKPKDFDPNKKYPLLVYVYGEPAGQTVLDRWGGRNYLWYSMLTQQGYIVMSFDNRGTPAPRGRDWRKIVYRQIGILAPQDQAAAVQSVLKTHPYIDPDRVGSWGWSGGGQMSLNAIFKYPEIYKMAMAIAFVSDQRLYDTIYQERYMGLPDDNQKGFHDGSPIHYAKNLQGNLLIVHGTGDDNVHYQSFERLVNELIRHNKIFTMMSYPNRTHSINEGKNTSLHLYSLLTRYLLENL